MKNISTKARHMRHLSLVALLLTMSFSLAANAQTRGNGQGRGQGQGYGQGNGQGNGQGYGKGARGPGHGLCRALRGPAIALSAEQAAQVQPLCEAMPDRVKPLIDEIEAVRTEVRAEMKKDAVDLGVVGGLHQQIAALRTEMASVHLELREQLRGILTPEQITKLQELREQRRGKRGGRGHRGGPGGGGGFGPGASGGSAW
jgi:periplasmic protein CpxP/Spy